MASRPDQTIIFSNHYEPQTSFPPESYYDIKPLSPKPLYPTYGDIINIWDIIGIHSLGLIQEKQRKQKIRFGMHLFLLPIGLV